MKRALCCAAVPVLLLAAGIGAYADDTVKVEKEELVLDDSWVDDYLMPNEYHYFPIVTETAGKVELKVQSFFEGGTYGEIEFLNADYEVLEDGDSAYIFGSKGEPNTVYFEYYLEPGEYYLRINADSGESNQGDVRIKGTFQDYESNEQEPNSDYHEAQELEENENIRGILTHGDEYDYYSFELTEKTDIEIVINVDEGEAMYSLYNEDLEKISEEYSPEGFVEEMTLEPGVYYAVIGNPPTPAGAVYNIKYRIAGKDYRAAETEPDSAAEEAKSES